MLLSIYSIMYMCISLVAIVQSILEWNDEQARYRYLVEMKIKVVLVRLFTIQGVRDEMLAKADGVEYVSKGGSSLTVVTRSKSGFDSQKTAGLRTSEMDTPNVTGNDTQRVAGGPPPPPGSSNMRRRSTVNGEMRVEDDYDAYYDEEVVGAVLGKGSNQEK